ncbi:MarR family transcriptional regulator [Aurantimonas sp. A2-1-M11]|uniref:MarR family winged helix-turn-helix transcriptional regulator n=1 Tax=Aurantimonas sp. A2-1-M11 TaxID=3113712 RepID=UPI002F92D164
MDEKSHLNVTISEYRLVKDLLRVGKLTRVYVDLAVREAGLVIGQDEMMRILSECQPKSVTAIAQRLGIRPPTASRMLSLLEAKGFVHRVADPHDRRKTGVVLTPDGAELQRSVEAIRQRLERELFRDLPPSEISAIRESLELLDGHLKNRAESLRKRQKPDTDEENALSFAR